MMKIKCFSGQHKLHVLEWKFSFMLKCWLCGECGSLNLSFPVMLGLKTVFLSVKMKVDTALESNPEVPKLWGAPHLSFFRGRHIYFEWNVGAW
jgi:hypothetical protein